VLEQKKARIDALRESAGRLKTLIARNKLLNEERHIGFPFLIVQPSTSEVPTQISVVMQSDLKKLAIRSSDAIEIISELQSLLILEAPSDKEIMRLEDITFDSGRHLNK
jgi:hypothetical protein